MNGSFDPQKGNIDASGGTAIYIELGTDYLKDG
jgi:hypothetical protein